jgi:hypothetical protein
LALTDRMKETLWGITCYFDSTGRKRRLQNYREFRRRLQVPLVAVELSFDGMFDLATDDADILIQARGGSILWQKERLLNLALQALPPACDMVAWLDCDTIFTRPDWPDAVRKLLKCHELVQPFEQLYHVPPDYTGNVMDIPRFQLPYQAIASCICKGTLLPESFRTAGSSQRYKYTPGLAWAAKRDTLQSHGFYDALIMGSGDKGMFSASCGRSADYADSAQMSSAAREHYHQWAEPFHKAIRGQIAYVEGDLFHLWHGDLVNRRYADRMTLFAQFAFDPCADIALNKEGVWCWSSDKPEMHEFVREHFERAQMQAVCRDPRAFPQSLEA